jgi:murein DD-endopeptidase MepM/ murein hydrolase activator NlpD
VLAIALTTAFYATFLPRRESTRAVGFTNSVDGLTYPAVVASPAAPEFLAVTVQTAPTAVTAPATPKSAVAPGTVFSTATQSSTTSFSAGLLAPVTEPATRITASGLPGVTLNTNPAVPAPAIAAAAQLPPCDTTVSVLYCVYTILEGDTLSVIAEKFGLKSTEDYIKWELLVHSNKPDIIDEEDLLQIGQKLRIPTRQAVLHVVGTGQTLSDIAEIYDVSMADIVALDINGISDINAITVGNELLVPNPKRFAKPAPPPPAPTAAPALRGGGGPARSAPEVVRGGQASQSGFIWPVSGRISSYFGPSHPLGIDIDLFSTPNAPIGAAAAGTVVFAGGNACCSYGYHVIVSHGNGLETLYAHFSSIAVDVGDKVSQGQLLGYGGRTGYATGNHLHFEVKVYGTSMNPLSYLP